MILLANIIFPTRTAMVTSAEVEKVITFFMKVMSFLSFLQINIHRIVRNKIRNNFGK